LLANPFNENRVLKLALMKQTKDERRSIDVNVPLRVTFLTVMPSPYTLDLFRTIEADGRILPQVLYMEMAAPDTYWGSVELPSYSRILPGRWTNFGGGRIHCNVGVIRAIQQTKPDVVVIAGYSSFTTQVAMRWLHWKQLPWVFWGEVPGMRRLKGWKNRLRSWAQYPAVAWPNAIAAIGTAAANEYRQLAHSTCDVANLPYVTDLSPFLNQLQQRADDGRIRILYCGQLIFRKGVDLLLSAFIHLAGEFSQLTLQFVGEGPLRETLNTNVPMELRSRVSFAGFQQIRELPQFFSESDIFVLPSRHDGWGVVVNQAIAAGLPVVCSNAVGAAKDLVTDGWNGYVFSAGNLEALKNSLRDLVQSRDHRLRFGANSRARSLEWTLEAGTDRWVEFLSSVAAGK
jgi:glycosyltransferase involved in cell wall biosynthesis